MFTYMVAKTRDEDLYILKNANICCGPCRSVDEDAVRTTVDGTTSKGVWRLKPHSGGTYRLSYPSLECDGHVRGRNTVFEFVRVCRACNDRYLEMTEHLARNPGDLEVEKDMARDAQTMIKKIEANGQAR